MVKWWTGGVAHCEFLNELGPCDQECQGCNTVIKLLNTQWSDSKACFWLFQLVCLNGLMDCEEMEPLWIMGSSTGVSSKPDLRPQAPGSEAVQDTTKGTSGRTSNNWRFWNFLSFLHSASRTLLSTTLPWPLVPSNITLPHALKMLQSKW